MLRKGWSLKQVRRTLAQGTVGKAIAIVLGIAMVAPSLAAPSAVANANPTREGANSVNSSKSKLVDYPSNTVVFPGGFQYYGIDTGYLQNMSDAIKVFYRTVLCAPDDCSILSVSFEGTELGNGSFIRLRDPKRPQSFYDYYELPESKVIFFQTAGSCVEVELWVAPRTSNRLQIQDIHWVKYSSDFTPADNCGICCGADDRIPSSALFAGRLVLVAQNGNASLCSAFLARYMYYDCILLFTAGHCIIDGYTNRSFVEFGDVPPSRWEGNRCEPVFTTDPEHIFSLGEARFEDRGPGRDWGVIIPGTNSEGLNPYQKYGYRLTIHNDIGDHMDGWLVHNVGYGRDDKPLQCERHLTQQFSRGRVVHVGDDDIIWTAGVDIRPGSSGSPLIESYTSTAIGIMTHCTPGCPNIAQRLDYWAIFNAYLQLCRCTGDVDNNRMVDDSDLAAVLFRSGESCWFCPEDLNLDGIVDDGDLLIVLSNFGARCP